MSKIRCEMVSITSGRDVQCKAPAEIFLKSRVPGRETELRARCSLHGPSEIALAIGYKEITWEEFVVAKVMGS